MYRVIVNAVHNTVSTAFWIDSSDLEMGSVLESLIQNALDMFTNTVKTLVMDM